MKVLILAILFFSAPLWAAHLENEKAYQERWCAEQKGVTEYVLDDRTRVDCLTVEYAVEVEFAAKWAESIGQALYYGIRTCRTPGVVLIMECEGDDRYLKRLQAVAEKYGIRIWTIQGAGK